MNRSVSDTDENSSPKTRMIRSVSSFNIIEESKKVWSHGKEAIGRFKSSFSNLTQSFTSSNDDSSSNDGMNISSDDNGRMHTTVEKKVVNKATFDSKNRLVSISTHLFKKWCRF